MKLSLEEYSSWLDTEIDKLVRPATSKGRKLLDESRGSIQEAERFFGDLSKKGDREMTTKKDPVSYRAARVIGHSAREAYETFSKIQLPEEVTWDSLKAARDTLSLSARSLRDSRNRTSGQLAGLYILDMRSYGGFVDRISRMSEKLAQFLEAEGVSLQKARILEGILTSVQDARNELSEREHDRDNLAKTSQQLAEEIHKLEAERDEVSNRSPLREVLEAEKRLRGESKEFRSVNLAHLQRPLRKLRDLSQRGEAPLGVDVRAALEKYIGSPYRSFLSRESGPHLAAILHDLGSALQSGKMGFKPRKAARVKAQLDQLLGGNTLSEKQQRGRELLSRRWTLLKDPSCKELYVARKSLLQRLEEARVRREETLTRIRSIEEMLTVLSKRLDELLEMTEARTAEYIGSRVDIERARPSLPAS